MSHRQSCSGHIPARCPSSYVTTLVAAAESVNTTITSPVFTESQNHRMVRVGRDLCGSSSPTLLPKQGHPEQAAEDLVQAGLEYLQRRRLHSLSGQPGPGLHHPQSEKITSLLRLNYFRYRRSCIWNTYLPRARTRSWGLSACSRTAQTWVETKEKGACCCFNADSHLL